MNLGKKTKVVCTIGPASGGVHRLSELVGAGMNVMRLNFSHGTHEEHQVRINDIREVMKKTGKIVAVLQDLSGPKIRVGSFKDKMIMLREGQKFTLTTQEVQGDENRVYINYHELPKEVKAGSVIMLDDGTKRLEVESVEGSEIVTKVMVGGRLTDHKGVNVPGANLSMKSLTDKDREDVKFGIKNNVDFVALSFVRRESDVKELREILNKAGSQAGIVAKVETPEALENIDAIIEASDAVMVARGDLAIEIPAEEVPLVQKLVIHKCNEVGKPVITATQMLESMLKNPVATRAEVSDVANAIIDGTDAVMLSEETALGDFPVEAVKMMTKIAQRVEKEVYTRDTIAEYGESHGITDVVSQSAVRTAHNVGAKLIVALTRSGRTARMISRYKPAEAILALSDAPQMANRLILTFGCYPVAVPTFDKLDEIMEIARKVTMDNKLIRRGDKMVLVAGAPFGKSNETNLILVESL